MRKQALIVLTALTAALALPMSALARGQALRVTVGPRLVGPHTNVLVQFRQPMTTGTNMTDQSFLALVISGPVRRGCIGSRRVILHAARSGTLMRHRLRPRWLGGRWCTGTYQGRVTYQVQPACGQPGPIRTGSFACPMLVMAPRTLATFHFHVTAR